MQMKKELCVQEIQKSIKTRQQDSSETYQIKDLIQYFEESAELTPFTIALEDNNKALTYKNLNLMSNQFANYFLEHGVDVGSIVVLNVSRSLEFICCCLALLKIEATYVPLDPRYSQSRINVLVNKLEPRLVISENELVFNHAEIRTVEEIKNGSINKSTLLKRRSYNPNSTAYIILPQAPQVSRRE